MDETHQLFSLLTPLKYGSPAPTQVLKQLRQVIIDKMKPDTRLPSEQMLARQFGVSKNVVREAMKVLASQGMVTVKQGSGTVVNGRSQWNVFDAEVLLATQGQITFEQLAEARRLLEPEIAARAASLANAQDKERIREMLRLQRPPVEEHVATDVEFHRRIAETARNPILVILLNSLGILLAEGRRVMYEIPGAVERALAQHQMIYQAIEDNDDQRARAAMEAHIKQISIDLKWSDPSQADGTQLR